MSTWSIPLARIAERANLRIETVVRKVTADVFREVVLKSPVDTGRFRANWNASYGNPNYSTSSATNQGRGLAEAAKALTLPVGGVTYMANGLPYARRLEYGYSKTQAPFGMVRLTAQRFSLYLQAATK